MVQLLDPTQCFVRYCTVWNSNGAEPRPRTPRAVAFAAGCKSKVQPSAAHGGQEEARSARMRVVHAAQGGVGPRTRQRRQYKVCVAEGGSGRLGPAGRPQLAGCWWLAARRCMLSVRGSAWPPPR